MRYFLFVVLNSLALMSSVGLKAQTTKSAGVEIQIDSLFVRLAKATESDVQDRVNDSIYTFIIDKLSDGKVFAPAFDSRRFGRVLSSDKKVCIYSWNYFNRKQGMIFNMIMQTKQGKVYSSIKAEAYVPNPLEKLGIEKWYGALYYRIEKFKMHRKEYYLLLGWSKVDVSTQMKIADVLSFENGVPVFGEGLFTKDGETFHSRLIFRYDWQVQMSLDYDKRKKSIVFDHLSPMQSSYPFEEPRYAPDMSVDAYKKKKSSWRYKEDINIKNN